MAMSAIFLLVPAILGILMFVMLIVLTVMHLNLSKRLNKLIGGANQKETIEAKLLELREYVENLGGDYERINSQIKDIYARLTPCIQKVGLIRYNPFPDMGGDLSFALALLDEKNDGIVINTIYGRDATFTYCKNLTNLQCNYTLSNEECEAIQLAAAGNGLVKK